MNHWFDMDYNEASVGDACNWESVSYAEPCDRKAIAVLYINRWEGDDMTDGIEIKLCPKHLAAIAGIAISAFNREEDAPCK